MYGTLNPSKVTCPACLASEELEQPSGLIKFTGSLSTSEVEAFRDRLRREFGRP